MTEDEKFMSKLCAVVVGVPILVAAVVGFAKGFLTVFFFG